MRERERDRERERERVLSFLQGIKPGPADYQKVTPSPPKLSYRPFGSSAPRLPEEEAESKRPPGYGMHNYDKSTGGGFGGYIIVDKTLMLLIPQVYYCDDWLHR